MKELPNEINGFKLLQDFGYINGSRRALVICKVCQEAYEVDPNKLIYRMHCGCMKRGGRVSKYTKTHSRIIQSYKHMKARCYNHRNKDFYNYGKKGISVCVEWLLNPDTFVEWAIENGYQEKLTIDRIDSKGNYTPENCRWANAKTQGRNTSRNVLTMELAKQMRIDSNAMTQKQLASKYNVCIATVWNVLHYRSWF